MGEAAKHVVEARQAEKKADARADAAEEEVAELQQTNKALQKTNTDMIQRDWAWEIVDAFFAVVFVSGVIAAFAFMRKMYVEHSAKQMTTIVHLNEERVKLFTKIQQQAARLPGKPTL